MKSDTSATVSHVSRGENARPLHTGSKYNIVRLASDLRYESTVGVARCDEPGEEAVLLPPGRAGPLANQIRAYGAEVDEERHEPGCS